MADAGKKKRVSFSPFRRRQEAARKRRLCIVWINRMVNIQVEKRNAELIDMNSMTVDLLKILMERIDQLEVQVKLVAEEARESSLKWRMEGENEEKTAWSYVRLNSLSTDKLSDTNCLFLTRTPPKQRKSSKLLLSVTSYGDSSGGDRSGGDTSDGDTSDGNTSASNTCDGNNNDGDTSDSETSDVSNGTDKSSQPAKCEQQENQRISTNVSTGSGQMMKDISSIPFHGNPSLITEEAAANRVPIHTRNEEEALLMEEQWTEWMDKLEMRINVKPVDQENTEKQAGAAPPVSKEETNQKVKEEKTMRKIKTYLTDHLNPYASLRWKRFEDED